MAACSNEIIGDIYTSSALWNCLREITDIGSRMAGHQGEIAGSKVIAATFRAAGCRDVERTRFEVPGWWRETARLSINPSDTGLRTFHHETDLVALPGSSDGDVRADVVDLGYGTPSDIETSDLNGKVALVSSSTPPQVTRPLNRTEQYARVVASGADGFVYVNDRTSGGVPKTGAVRFGSDMPGPIPAVGVSQELGERLRRGTRLDNSEIRLTVDCYTESATSSNVEAVVGPETGPEIVITAHVDSHDIGEGARDNAAGCALLSEAARVFAAMDDELNARVRFLATGAEEIGLLGSQHWVRTTDTDAVAAHVNLDVIGFSPTLGVEGTRELEEVFATARAELGPVTDPGRTGDPYAQTWPFWYGDQWHFLTHGIPSVTCRSVPDATDSTLQWGHTRGDTIDKLDRRHLRELAIQIVNGLLVLTDRIDTIEPPSERKIRRQIPQGTEEYLRMDGRWPWSD